MLGEGEVMVISVRSSSIFWNRLRAFRLRKVRLLKLLDCDITIIVAQIA